MTGELTDSVLATEEKPLIRLHGVSAGYGRVTVLRDISLAVAPGAVVGVLGPNGAGKSTLLKAISGQVPVSTGTITFDGRDLGAVNAVSRARMGISHVPEGRGIFRSLTVRENLLLFAHYARDGGALDRVFEAFPFLASRREQRAGSLSGGEQQMLAMAAAYCRAVKLVMVDEPSLGLAPRITDRVFNFLADLAAQGAALIIVDQFADRVMELASHVNILQRGSIVFSGPTETMAEDIFQYYAGSDLSTQGGME